MFHAHPAVRSTPASFPGNIAPTEPLAHADRMPAPPPSPARPLSVQTSGTHAALQPPRVQFALRPGVKLPLERQLQALEGTAAYQTLITTPQFAAYKAAFEADLHITQRLAGLVGAFVDLYPTDAFTAFRLTRQARALRDTLSRCAAEGCTHAQQTLIDSSVTLSLFNDDWLIDAARQSGAGEQYPSF